MSDVSAFSAPSGVTGMTVIGTYADYADAQRLVDFLSDKGFAVQHLRIIGRGLHSVEQVVGRVTKWRAALSGLVSGALLGLLFGWLLSIFVDGNDWWKPLLVGAAFGAFWGAVTGFIAQAMTGGKRDFASVKGVAADTYEVEVDADQADSARQLVAQLPQKLTSATG